MTPGTSCRGCASVISRSTCSAAGVSGEHELHVTSIEQALLYLLAANAGTEPRYIETVPVAGYRFVATADGE